MSGTTQEHGPELKRGAHLMACRQENRLPGQIMNCARQRLVLEFPERPSPRFEAGEHFQLHFWDDENDLHVFQAQVLQIAGYGRQVEVQIQDHRVEKRQHQRFEVSIPVHATVVQARHDDLVGKKFECETKDISLGGLLTETPLSLTLGDRLQLDLELGAGEQLHTLVWVVRSKMVRNQEFVGAVVIRSSNWLGLEFQLPPDDQLKLLKFLLKKGRKGQPVQPSAESAPASSEAPQHP